MKTLTKTLKGSDGIEYIYTLNQHAAGEGLELFARVTGACGGSIGKMFASLGLDAFAEKVKKEASGGSTDTGGAVDTLTSTVMQMDVSEALGMIDTAQMGEGLTTLAASFLTHGGANLCRNILLHTTRAPVAEGAGVKLGSANGFDAAYRGNYREMVQAVGWAFWCNFGCMFGDDPFARG